MSLETVVTEFNRDGFAVLPAFFSAAELAAVNQEVDRIIAGQAEYMPAEELAWEKDTAPGTLRDAFRMHRYHTAFMDLARHARMTEVAARLLGAPLRLYASQMFAKQPRVGSVVPLHQDMPYWPFDPPEMITFWIALDESRRENGCVRFLPGSHRLGRLHHVASGVHGNSLRTEDPRVEGLPETAIEIEAGSICLHHALAAHRSDPNTSDKPRRGLIYVYMSPAVRVTDESKLRKPYEFPVVRESL